MKNIFIFTPADSLSGHDKTRPLTQKGERQARLTGENLPTFNLVLAPPTRRAFRTATLLSQTGNDRQDRSAMMTMKELYEPHDAENIQKSRRIHMEVRHRDIATVNASTKRKTKSNSGVSIIRETIKDMEEEIKGDINVLIVTHEKMVRTIVEGLASSHLCLVENYHARQTIENLKLQPCEGIHLELNADQQLIGAEHIECKTT